MKIYTSYFAKVKELEEAGLVVIPISSSIPGSIAKSYSSLEAMRYRKLAPPWYVLKQYKEDNDQKRYIEDYTRLVLNNLDPHEVVKHLEHRSLGCDVVLVCYEKPESFCHRHLVADWLNKAGYDVQEWTRG